MPLVPIPAPPLVDAAAGTPSLRTLGTGAQQAAPGNDPRFGTPADAQVTPAPAKIPLADGAGLINPGWLADASAVLRGLVSLGAQTWAGVKTFSSPIVIGTVGIDPAGSTNGQVMAYDSGAVKYAPVTLNFDMIAAAFSLSLSPSFTTTKELGDAITDPAFTASYNRPAFFAELNDGSGFVTLTVPPYTSFAYGTAPLPGTVYNSSVINAITTWTLRANEAGGPLKTSSVSAAWRPRVFQGLSIPAHGTGVSISGTAPTMTLTSSEARFNAAMVGRSITIAGATSGANNGSFVVVTFNSATSIDYTNASGVAEAFTGTWSMFDEYYVENLPTSALQSGFGGTYSFASGGGTQAAVIAYPTAFGTPSSITSGGFPFPMASVATAVPVTNAFSVVVAGGYTIIESGLTIVPFVVSVS